MTAYRYRQLVLEELGRHGLAPGPETPPAFLRAAINDLYRYEVRRLRDACRSGAFPTNALPARVVELRRRYMLLSIPLERWLDA